MFQHSQLENVRTNIRVLLTSMAIQVNKLKKLNHVLDEEYQITHILASRPREYSSVVKQVKIDRRTGSTLKTMDEIKKRFNDTANEICHKTGIFDLINIYSGQIRPENLVSIFYLGFVLNKPFYSNLF